jgi:outer membrane protein assembly factor BamB
MRYASLERRHMRRLAVAVSCLGILVSAGISSSLAGDWPMWRNDAGRTGVTKTTLPESLHVKWTRHLPQVIPAYHSTRLQFDAGYEPIVADGRLLIASSRTDSVTAYDAATGRELWVYRTNGPVRLAPAVWNDSVCFGSDDGHLYCVDLKTGDLRWKHRAVPNDRRLLGNQRLISVWPVRGGAVVADGNVYFAAGVWPFEGVFVYCMEIATGKVVWRNDRLGYLFGNQPHNTQSIGGLAPQGYLVINNGELIVPCSTAYPARLNRQTGELIEFELPTTPRFPGGWFAAMDPDTARAIRRGKLTFDDVVNRERHEDKVNRGHGESGISRMIHAGSDVLNFDDTIDGVDGTIHSMIIADEQVFVSTQEGLIYCLETTNKSANAEVKHWPKPATELAASPQANDFARKLVAEADGPHGYAVVVGLIDGGIVKALLQKSQYHVVAISDDSALVERLRRELGSTGLYGQRVSIIESDTQQANLPPYMAAMVTTETPEQIADSWSVLLQSLRPFGGIAALRTQSDRTGELDTTLESLKPGTFERSELEGETLIRRVGALLGAVDYTGDYALCEDELVQFPLGVLWFDDSLSHFKRSPQPRFIKGTMISRPKNWHTPRGSANNYAVDYPLLPPVLSDIYTGRVLNEAELTTLRSQLPEIDPSKQQPSQYHSMPQTKMVNADLPDTNIRTNPLTGRKEPRTFPKTYGCDGGVNYGLIHTFRSGTPAFYDQRLESGTVFLSGPRSGCTNSIIPSGGVLNVPYFYDGCTCSYPLPTAMSLVAMPENHEQWSAWGRQEIEAESIERIGINLGAPGDRMTRDGTLWLDYPSIGGPSPDVTISTIPEQPRYLYHHSLWMNAGKGWPWVAASGAEGIRQLKLSDLKPGPYTVRLFFTELNDMQEGDRVQTVSIQGREVLNDFDILAEATETMKGIVREFDDVNVSDGLTLELSSTKGRTLISGIEVIRKP